VESPGERREIGKSVGLAGSEYNTTYLSPFPKSAALPNKYNLEHSIPLNNPRYP